MPDCKRHLWRGKTLCKRHLCRSLGGCAGLQFSGCSAKLTIDHGGG